MLKPAVEHLIKSHKQGIKWDHPDGRVCITFVRIHSFPVDAVQRPELVPLLGHGGKCSCPHCMIVGKRVQMKDNTGNTSKKSTGGKTVPVDTLDESGHLVTFGERKYTQPTGREFVILNLPGFSHKWFTNDPLHTNYLGVVKYMIKGTKLLDHKTVRGRERAAVVDSLINAMQTPSWVITRYFNFHFLS